MESRFSTWLALVYKDMAEYAKSDNSNIRHAAKTALSGLADACQKMPHVWVCDTCGLRFYDPAIGGMTQKFNCPDCRAMLKEDE